MEISAVLVSTPEKESTTIIESSLSMRDMIGYGITPVMSGGLRSTPNMKHTGRSIALPWRSATESRHTRTVSPSENGVGGVKVRVSLTNLSLMPSTEYIVEFTLSRIDDVSMPSESLMAIIICLAAQEVHSLSFGSTISTIGAPHGFILKCPIVDAVEPHSLIAIICQSYALLQYGLGSQNTVVSRVASVSPFTMTMKESACEGLSHSR